MVESDNRAEATIFQYFDRLAGAHMTLSNWLNMVFRASSLDLPHEQSELIKRLIESVQYLLPESLQVNTSSSSHLYQRLLTTVINLKIMCDRISFEIGVQHRTAAFDVEQLLGDVELMEDITRKSSRDNFTPFMRDDIGNGTQWKRRHK